MKLSPLSVPYRVVERGGSLLVAAVFVVFSGGSMLDGIAGPLTLVALLGVAVLALVGYQVAYYQRYEYELTSDTFDIHSGVFARREREIPLRRIQNVDISRNVAQRVLGIAVVDFETAGGSDTEASLRYVSFEEAKRLQRDIPRLKRGVDPDADDAETDPEPTTELFALSDRELSLVGLLSFDFRVPGVLALVLSGSVPVIPSLVPGRGAVPLALFLVLLVVGVVLFSWVVGAAVAVVNYYDFRLVRTGDELQYERGLLQRYDGSIPFDKLQTLTVEDTPLKRWFGYATLLIETAGYAPGQSSGGGRGSEAAVPLAERDRVFELANAIEPIGDPDLRRPPKRVRRRYAFRYLIAIATVTGFLFAVDAALTSLTTLGSLPVSPFLPVAAVVVVPVAAHLKWVHRGYWLGDDHVVTRNGVLKRQTKVVPYSRIQTVIDTRTLFQRRWNLATVTVDTAGSLSITGGDAAAVDVDDAVADELRAELDARLRAALAERRERHRAKRRGTEPSIRSASASTPPSPSVDPSPADDIGDADESGTDGFVWGDSRATPDAADEHDDSTIQRDTSRADANDDAETEGAASEQSEPTATPPDDGQSTESEDAHPSEESTDDADGR
jgi:putative membrane protein